MTPGANGRGNGGGHGLLGMRERVSIYGGDLDVGPRPEGGSRLRARLPVLRDRPAGRLAGPGHPMSLGVLIADDQALVRAGFRLILDAETDLEVVGEAEDGYEAVAAARRLLPDIVLMDVRMPGLERD